MIFLFCFISANAQAQSAQFPDDFFGIYSGNLLISAEKGSQTVPMELHLLPTDTEGKYKYNLVYGEGASKQVRNYFLIEKDRIKGNYIIDEDNGIILDAKLLDNKLYCLFEVNQTLLTTSITFESSLIKFEITAAKTDKERISKANNEAETKVTSYLISTVQQALLQKQ